ncbi:MAG: pyridoxamine 5'-phosphate oxidase family protein [Anaerolineae bacterium]
MRRKDREVTEERWIVEFLHRQPFGFLATAANGEPHLNSNLYVYDEDAHAIYLHTARVGRTRAEIGAGTAVCFTVAEMGRLLPAAEALEFSVEYASVMIFGQAHLVEDVERKRQTLQLMLDKYAPHLQPSTDYRPITTDELKRTSVFEVVIDHWTAKQKKVPEDFPCAFRYGDPDIFKE